VRASREIASFDSASGFLRATARFLHGRDFDALGMPRQKSMQPAMLAANRLPARARRLLYTKASGREALPPERLAGVSAEALADDMARLYPARRYPAVVVGASSGALVHLCAALGLPWLPQTVLVPVRQRRVRPDQLLRGMETAKGPARLLLDANPDLVLHQMHDPNADRLTLRELAYFRVKRTRLGPAWERFLRERLEPGATIVVADCLRTWPTTLVGERHVFQAGAVGGATTREYLEGGPRVANYLGREGQRALRWEAPRPDGERPEAEWGFEPALGDDVARFARDHGYRLRRLVFPEPDDLSPLVADLYRWWYAQRGLPAHRLLVESFLLLDPWWTLRTGSVPFWMTFNMEPSAGHLATYLDRAEPFDHIELALFAHGVESVGLTPMEHWWTLLEHARVRGRLLGVDPRTFPADLGVFARFWRELRRLPARYPMPRPLPLSQFEAWLAREGERYPVEWLPAA
jgi:hypothetical protein